MAVALRPYQQALIDSALPLLGDRRRVVVQLPTGGGKSVLFGAIAQHYYKTGKPCLIIAHREELIAQAFGHVDGWCGPGSAGILKAGHPVQANRPIQILSIASARRLDKLEDFAAVIVDEAHHATAASYQAVLKRYPQAAVLGLTATPCRADGRGFGDLFDSLVCGPSTAALIEQGYLSPLRYYGDPDPLKTKGVAIKAGDYNQRQLAQENNPLLYVGQLISAYRRHTDGLRCCVFAINLAHSRTIAASYQAAGIPAAHLDGESHPDDRRETLERFKAGEIKVLCNVGLFGEGVDIPALEAVQIARPTKSLALYLQMCGRVLRVAPGKDAGIVLDHTENWLQHGLPTEERQWTLMGSTRDQKKLKLNPQGEVVEVEPIVIDEVPVALEEIKASARPVLSAEAADQWRSLFAELVARVEQRGWKPASIYYRLIEEKAPYEVWQWYAAYRGHAPGSAWHNWRKCHGLDPPEAKSETERPVLRERS